LHEPLAGIDGATKDVSGVYQVEPELLADSTARKVLVEILSVNSLDNEETVCREHARPSRNARNGGLEESLGALESGTTSGP
jgi:hypothetical protein